MRKITMSLLGLFLMFALVACGGSSNKSNDEDNVTSNIPQDFALIGAIDCRGISSTGGEVKLTAKVNYDDKIKRDSFTYSYSVDGNTINFETPIVSLTADASAYLLNGDMYIYANETNDEVLHVFDLTYLDGGIQRLFRGACKQGKYVNVVETIYVVVAQNDSEQEESESDDSNESNGTE